mmetsp:Transcript_118815/g.330244  ORF Transcript_118815/g.330244 Transcript_118815/m.330244 type:complete len:150 (-) Transcript_118815:110-559(-)
MLLRMGALDDESLVATAVPASRLLGDLPSEPFLCDGLHADVICLPTRALRPPSVPEPEAEEPRAGLELEVPLADWARAPSGPRRFGRSSPRALRRRLRWAELQALRDADAAKAHRERPAGISVPDDAGVAMHRMCCSGKGGRGGARTSG